jgi:hypothetical protein
MYMYVNATSLPPNSLPDGKVGVEGTSRRDKSEESGGGGLLFALESRQAYAPVLERRPPVLYGFITGPHL